MKRTFLALLAAVWLLLPCATDLTADIVLIKNVSVFQPEGNYLRDARIVVDGRKIRWVGQGQEPSGLCFDKVIDGGGGFVYPGLIDAFSSGWQKKSVDEKAAPKPHDKEVRKSRAERGITPLARSVEHLKLSQGEIRKAARAGFTVVHVVPGGGTCSGTSAVLSLTGTTAADTVLVADVFMLLRLNRNRRDYPTTLSSVLYEWLQLQEDARFHRDMAKAQFRDIRLRRRYAPDLERLDEYFRAGRGWMIPVDNLVEHRLAGKWMRKSRQTAVLVAGPEVWRSPVKPGENLVLRLDFSPDPVSRYAQLGEKLAGKAKKEVYPRELAAFLLDHPRTCLAPADAGDFKSLLKNLRRLKKNGVSEARLINALTRIPAALLGVDDYVGAVAPGRLASFFVTDKPFLEEKSRILRTFIEGREYDFSVEDKSSKPPAANLTGAWKVTVTSRMGVFELQLTLEQEGNRLSGRFSSAMGTMDIDEGRMSGTEVSLTASAPIGGQDTVLAFSAQWADGRMKGTVSMGTFGEATFTAVPEGQDNNGQAEEAI